MTSTSVSEENSAPAACELLLELEVVLDDPVDHDVDAVVRVVVRVGVLLGDAAVRRPAGVADAGRRRPVAVGDGAVVASAVDGVAQAAEVADGAHGAQLAVLEQGDARGVIAAVLELLEPGQQDVLHRRWPT